MENGSKYDEAVWLHAIAAEYEREQKMEKYACGVD